MALNAWIVDRAGALAAILAAVGGIIIWRAVARPLNEITKVTEAGRGGSARGSSFPFGERHDEVGALARSITVFQQAMRRNDASSTVPLPETAEGASRARSRWRRKSSGSATRWSRRWASWARIADGCAGRGRQSGDRGRPGLRRRPPVPPATASEASGNVRDIASAAEELTASVSRRSIARWRSPTHRRACGQRSRADQGASQGPRRGRTRIGDGGPADHRDRGADQSAGSQRDHRGGARRRCRPRLRGGGAMR